MIDVSARTLLDWAAKLFTMKSDVADGTFRTYALKADESFEECHACYLASFQRYKAMIREDLGLIRPNSPLFDAILDDNRLAANTRSALLELAKAGNFDTMEMEREFITVSGGAREAISAYVTAIGQYLLRERAGSDRVIDQIWQEHPDHIFSQRFRNTLVDDLRAVIEEDWQRCLDPSASGPPMDWETLTSMISDIARNAGIADDDPDRDRKLHQAMAVMAVDVVIEEMQEAYTVVKSRFYKVKVALRITD